MTSVSSPSISTSSTPGFERDAVAVLKRLSVAIRLLIDASPGPTRRPADLQRSLGIHAKLAWQAHRIAFAEDPIAEAGNVPGNAAIGRFLDAAGKRGIKESLIHDVRLAHEEFQALIKSHATSRDAFDSMASGITKNGSSQVDLHYKRWAFKSASHLWGVQAKAQLSSFIHWPSASDPDRMDIVSLRGLIDLQRFRRNVSWIVSRTRLTDDDGIARRKADRHPIEQDDQDPMQLGLLRKFCSKSLPKLRAVPGEEEFWKVCIEGDAVGNQSSVTCLFADCWRNAFPIYRDEHNKHHSYGSMIRTPSEVLIRDVFFPDAAQVDPATMSAHVLGDHRTQKQGIENRDQDRLALREEMVYLGKGLDMADLPEVPRYAEMIEYILNRLGWHAGGLHLFRLRMEYPVMPSTVVTQFACATRPTT